MFRFPTFKFQTLMKKNMTKMSVLCRQGGFQYLQELEDDKKVKAVTKPMPYYCKKYTGYGHSGFLG
jgi:hypothetical protein